MQTYVQHGGTSAILIHDDGLQFLSKEDQEKRIFFYPDHNIGWIAPPGPIWVTQMSQMASSVLVGSRKLRIWIMGSRLVRAYAFQYSTFLFLRQLSLCMEKHILALEAFDYKGELSLEEQGLELSIKETYEATGENGNLGPKAQDLCALGIS